jgi:cation diffusion facilitator CzcD-associated flavoprotein CzcO
MAEGKIAPVIVIGAGAAGLAAADALARRGVEAVVLEKEPRVGEQWRRRHDQLRLNTHRRYSSLHGAPYPRKVGSFPHKNVVASYLERFAAERRLDIRFGVTATRIERDDEGWLVKAGEKEFRAANVVIATGRDRVPWMPNWEGADSFRGRLIHSAQFGNVSAYAGKRVLVVGAGNSGFDALNHLSKIETGQMWLSVRNGPALLPKRFAGVTVHQLAGAMERLPLSWADWVLSATQRLAFGDLTRLGLPRTPKGGASRLAWEQTAIAVDEGAVKAMKDGRIKVVAPVARFAGDRVELRDGQRIDPDIVIAATGYRTGLEPLLGGLDVLDQHGRPKLERGRLDALPGLWFLGMRPGLSGDFHSSMKQAEKIAAEIAGR